jgi:hypothetical protein
MFLIVSTCTHLHEGLNTLEERKEPFNADVPSQHYRVIATPEALAAAMMANEGDTLFVVRAVEGSNAVQIDQAVLVDAVEVDYSVPFSEDMIEFLQENDEFWTEEVILALIHVAIRKQAMDLLEQLLTAVGPLTDTQKGALVKEATTREMVQYLEDVLMLETDLETALQQNNMETLQARLNSGECDLGEIIDATVRYGSPEQLETILSMNGVSLQHPYTFRSAVRSGRDAMVHFLIRKGTVPDYASFLEALDVFEYGVAQILLENGVTIPPEDREALFTRLVIQDGAETVFNTWIHHGFANGLDPVELEQYALFAEDEDNTSILRMFVQYELVDVAVLESRAYWQEYQNLHQNASMGIIVPRNVKTD